MRARGPARQRLLPRQGLPRRAARDDRHRASDRGRARRDPYAISITFGSPAIFGDDPVGAAQELAELGVSRVIVPAFLLRKPSERDAMEAFAERVIKPTASIG